MFGYGLDRRAITIFMVILIIIGVMGMTTQAWIRLLLTLPCVLISIAFHEFAHANAADKLGDTTPRNQGRLTLNPTSHIDPFGFVLLMFAGIGWGKPVQVNPNNFTSNKSRGFCESMVALAGPLMNFVIAIVACVAYYAMYCFASGFVATQMGELLILFLELLITTNIGLGVFNLIPLPPLDGEKIFRNSLPYKAQRWLEENYPTFTTLFMLLWVFGILEYIVTPIVSTIVEVLVFLVEKAFLLFL